MDRSIILVRKILAQISFVLLMSIFTPVAIFLETIAYILFYIVLFVGAVFGAVNPLKESWVNRFPLCWKYSKHLYTNIYNWRTDLAGECDYWKLIPLDSEYSVIHYPILIIAALTVILAVGTMTFSLIGWWFILVAFLLYIAFSLVYCSEQADKENNGVLSKNDDSSDKKT